MGFPAEFYLSKSDKIKQILKTEILWTFEHTTAKHGTKKQRKEIPGQFQFLPQSNFAGKTGKLEYSHSFNDQIGGQLEAGFVITGFYEDHDPFALMGQYMPTFFAVKAKKPGLG